MSKTPKEALAEIKKLLGFSETPPPPDPAKFTDAKLKDGTTIKVDGDMVAGAKVTVVTPTGDAPAPDGELELEDGTKLTVAGGVITEVKPVGTGAAAMSEETTAAIANLQNSINELKAEFEKSKNATVPKTDFEKVKTELATQKDVNKKMLDLMEQFAKTPAASPAGQQKNAFTSTVTHDERLQEMANTIQSIKNVQK